MSWSISELIDEKEKKEYENKGTATLSVEQLMDMQNDITKLKTALVNEHRDWYEEHTKRADFESQNKKMAEKLETLQEWLDSDDASRTAYKLFLAEKKMKEQDEED